MRKRKPLASGLKPILTLLWSPIIAASLGGCAAWLDQTVTGEAKHVCRSWKPIYPSRQCDTLSNRTAADIAGNNAAREPWCGKTPPPPKDDCKPPSDPQKHTS